MLQFRIADVCDSERLLEIYEYYVLKTAVSFEYELPSVEKFSNRIVNVLKKYPYIVGLNNGKIVGYGYASPFKQRKAYEHSAEVSIYIDKPYQRKGYGSQLYLFLEDILKKQGILNLNACIAYTSHKDENLNNVSSIFHKSIGYSMVGRFHKCGYKFNKWYDMIWMEKHIGQHLDNAPEIKTFLEVRDDFDL